MIRKRLRALALLLIAFPEPITTVLGVALLLATVNLAIRRRLESFGDPEKLVKMSLQGVGNLKWEGSLSAKKQSVFHALNINHPLEPIIIPGGLDNPVDSKENLPTTLPVVTAQNSDIAAEYNGAAAMAHLQIQHYSWFDNRKVSEKILHHTLKTSLPQYEATPVAVPDGDDKTVHHTLKDALPYEPILN